MSNMPPHQRKASNMYGAAGPPQKSPRLWKFAPARGAPAGATTVLPYEAVSFAFYPFGALFMSDAASPQHLLLHAASSHSRCPHHMSQCCVILLTRVQYLTTVLR